MSHRHRLGFRVHQDLVLSVQRNRLMVGMTDASTNVHDRIAFLCNPRMMLDLWPLADYSGALRFGQATRVLVADVNQRSSLTDNLFANIWLTTTPPRNRLVLENQTFIHEHRITHRHEEPFALTAEGFVFSAMRLRHRLQPQRNNRFKRGGLIEFPSVNHEAACRGRQRYSTRRRLLGDGSPPSSCRVSHKLRPSQLHAIAHERRRTAT